MNITLDIAGVLAAIIWPLLAMIVLLVVREHIPDIVKWLAGRVKKLEFAGISLELAEAKPFAPDWSGAPGALDLRSKATSAQITDSTRRTFMTQLLETSNADYAIVNLGSGEEWLTSRLYIMAILYARTKQVRAMVFLETTQDVRKRYVGWSEPERVRWALGRRYPWLEAAYADAYSQVMANQNVVIVSSQGKLGYAYQANDAQPSVDLLQEFLHRIQVQLAPPAVPQEPESWVIVEKSLTYEHARWLDSAHLEELLGDDLHTSQLRASELKAMEFHRQVRAILGLSGSFVALTEENGRFKKLIDRAAVLEQSTDKFLQKIST